MLLYVGQCSARGCGLGWSSGGHWRDWAGGRQQLGLGPSLLPACLPAVTLWMPYQEW